jgi:FtsP/CotA-like multicopper oxidase with cupredoxin domain
MTTRRQFLAGAGALVGAAALGAAPVRGQGSGGVVLEAAERPQALPCFGGGTLPTWTFSDAPTTVLRIPAGKPFRATLVNALPREGEHATIHWHGIRLQNAADGVPYLTQEPVLPGKSFVYDFTPPDPGSFFFHTHCNTPEQLGRGLAGILLVEGDETEPYDAERLVVLRDWGIAEDGSFSPFYTAEGATHAGTFGNVRSANGAADPAIAVPASADVRLRILNIDRSRIMQLGIEGAECHVAAIDGMPITPFPLEAWFAGPAGRIDVVMRSPGAGGEARLVDYFAPKPVPLARFRAEGSAIRTGAFRPAPLRPPSLPEPDLSGAERIPFVFSATATAAAVSALPAISAEGLYLDDLCTSEAAFWAINKRVWPAGDHSRIPPPLAELKRGGSYIFELENTTARMHPIHVHGHSFKVLSSNKRVLPAHWADTILLMPKERIEVAFVADNPGDWMFHCHVIEHQETGMMGYIRVA